MIKTAKIRNGYVRGSAAADPRIISFKGIPYAQSPTGENRWRAPRPCEDWNGVRECIEFSPICMQSIPGLDKENIYTKEWNVDSEIPMSEDSLYLNVWTPARTPDDRLPVFIWIHGGALQWGNTAEMEFDGEKYASHDVILVTVNYRVGVFGFYADPVLTKENTFHTTGNYGLLDQIMALQWVYDNIDVFHGDRNRITVFGQSAGAMSTQALITSPLTKGLIHSAIFQSGAGVENGITRTKKMSDAYHTGDLIRKLCKVKNVNALRKLDASKLVSILPELYKECGGLAFGPVNDGYLLQEDMDVAAKNGRIHNIPYMIGMTSDDITIEKGTDARKSKFYEGCMKFLELRLIYSKKPCYMYYFSKSLPSDDAGAFHSSELWYMFGTLDRCWRNMNARDYRLSEAMITAWTNFMKDDDPGAQWKPYTKKEQFVRNFM